jgi:hypothetical protein
MALSIEQLTNPIDEDEALQQVLDIFESLGFSARSWQSGSIPRTFAEYMAKFRADISVLTTDIAKGFLNSLSTGDFLTLFSASHYQNDRVDPVRTRGSIEVVTAVGAGPFTQQPGEILVQTAEGIAYRNRNVMTLTSGSTVVDEFEAEVASADANVANDTIDILVTGLAGVTVNNPDPGSGSWITRAGANVELDPELQTRNRDKWTTLSATPPDEFYELATLEADASITRAFVDDTNARGAGKIDIYIADETGGITTPSVLVDVQAAVELKAAKTATIAIFAAIDLIIPVSLDLFYDPTFFATPAAAEAAVTTAINTHFENYPINGRGFNDVFSLGLLYSAILAIPGVVNCAISDPTADVPMVTPTGQVAIPGAVTFDTTTAVVP